MGILSGARERLGADGLLSLDGGDALYRRLVEAPPEKVEQERARKILEVMGTAGTDAMAVGPRDVAGGLKLLQKGAAKAEIPLLSANLLDKRGRPVFPASIVIERAGLRIGVIGVSSADLRVSEARAYLWAKLTAGAPIPAVQAAVKGLEGKADLILLLGRLTTKEMREVVAQVKLPLAFVGSTGQVTSGGSRVGSALVYDGGFRGQALQRVDLRVSRPGALFQDSQERVVVASEGKLETPNDARATALYLDTFKPIDAGVDAALEATRSPEELEARKKKRGRGPKRGP